MHIMFLMPLFISYLDGATSLLRSISNSGHEISTSYSNLLREIAETHFGVCHHVILSNPAENQVLKETRKKFQQNSGVSLSFDWSHLDKSLQGNILRFTPAPENQKAEQTAPEYCVTYFILTRNYFLPQLATDMAKSNWFPGSTRYLVILMDNSISKSSLNILSNELGLLFHIIFIETSKSNHTKNLQEIKVAEINPFSKSNNSGSTEKGYWKPTTGLVVKIPLIGEFTQNFQEHIFRVSALSAAVYFTYYKENGNFYFKDCFDGRMFDLLGSLYNFTYKVLEPSDNLWGYQFDNGSYTGVIGLVQRKEADFTSGININLQRSTAVALTIQYTVDNLVLVIGKPKALPHWKSIIRPFKMEAWICISLAVLISPFIFVILQRKVKEPGNSLTELSLELFGSLLTQHFRWTLSRASAMFIASFLLFSLVVSKIYVSNLASYLTIPVKSPAINTLEDLVQSDFSWGTDRVGGAIYELFKTSQAPIYKAIFSKMGKCSDLSECILRASKDHYGYIAWKISISQAIAQNFTDSDGEPLAQTAREEFYPTGLGYGLQKGSLLKQPFDKVIQRLTEGGILQKWMRDIIQMKDSSITNSSQPKQKDEPVEPEDKTIRLTFQHVQGIFIVYIAGIALSFIVFLMEIFVSKFVFLKDSVVALQNMTDLV